MVTDDGMSQNLGARFMLNMKSFKSSKSEISSIRC